MRTGKMLTAIISVAFLMVMLQSCEETKEYHVMLKVYNLTTTDTIQFGASSSAALQSSEILPGGNSTIEVRKIQAIPYKDITSVDCFVAKDGSIVGQTYGERVVPYETHVVLSFHWDGHNLEFMN